jgi:hypothetical protein
MIVRIRFATGTRIGRKPTERRSIASGIGALLTPAAVATAILGFWRLAADLKWAGDFFIESGFFSHWQVWLIAAAMLQLAAYRLRRFGAASLLRKSQPPVDEFAPQHPRTRAL